MVVQEIFLDGTSIKVFNYAEEKENGLNRITIDFKVSSDDYHAITTLLYKGTFNVSVPARELVFTGTIHQYSTFFTNLYEKGQVGDFHLSLLEIVK